MSAGYRATAHCALCEWTGPAEFLQRHALHAHEIDTEPATLTEGFTLYATVEGDRISDLLEPWLRANSVAADAIREGIRAGYRRGVSDGFAQGVAAECKRRET